MGVLGITDPTAQIILALEIGLVAIGLVTFAIIIVWRRGIKAKGKKGQSIEIPGDHDSMEGCSDPSSPVMLTTEAFEDFFELVIEVVRDLHALETEGALGKKMEIVEQSLVKLRSLKESKFYRMLMDKGVDHGHLTAHCDAQFYIQALGCAIYQDNGVIGLKTVIRREMKSKNYHPPATIQKDSREWDLFIENYARNFVDGAVHALKRFFYLNYKTDVYDESGVYSRRLITSEALHDSDTDKEHVNECVVLFTKMFRDAITIDIAIDIERAELIAKKKMRIKRAAGLCGEVRQQGQR